MKKVLIFAAAAALVLAGCAKNEVVSTVGANEEIPIGFGSYAGRTLTKATTDSYVGPGTATFTATNQHIGVYAYVGTATASTFMNNVDVELLGNGATASTSYTPIRYWPKEAVPANAIDFIAYYPYGGTGITGAGIGNTTENDHYGTLGFTVQDAIADQVDFMYADPVEDQYYSTNGGVVPFVFHHALTRVLFQVKAADTYTGTTIKVKSLSIDNIKKTGTLTLGATATWGTTPTGAQTYSFPDISSHALTTTAYPEEDPSASPAVYADASYVFLLMPQSIADAAMLRIQYEITDDGTGVVTTNNANVQLNTITDGSTPIATWSINQNVVYTITIGLKPIQFTGTVTNWAATTSGNWILN